MLHEHIEHESSLWWSRIITSKAYQTIWFFAHFYILNRKCNGKVDKTSMKENLATGMDWKRHMDSQIRWSYLANSRFCPLDPATTAHLEMAYRDRIHCVSFKAREVRRDHNGLAHPLETECVVVFNYQRTPKHVSDKMGRFHFLFLHNDSVPYLLHRSRHALPSWASHFSCTKDAYSSCAAWLWKWKWKHGVMFGWVERAKQWNPCS